MTTYTVFNMEDDEACQARNGLSLSEAFNLRLKRAEVTARIERVPAGWHIVWDADDVWRLEGLPRIESRLTDELSAKREIMEQALKIPLPGSWMVMSDAEFIIGKVKRERGRLH